MLGVALCVIAYDVVGFFVGSQFGHSRDRARGSRRTRPSKARSRGMLASSSSGVIVGQIAPWTSARALVLGVLVAVGAFIGDLCESMLKRDLGVKDFGVAAARPRRRARPLRLLLFCLPIAYYLALQFKIF